MQAQDLARQLAELRAAHERTLRRIDVLTRLTHQRVSAMDDLHEYDPWMTMAVRSLLSAIRREVRGRNDDDERDQATSSSMRSSRSRSRSAESKGTGKGKRGRGSR